KALEEHAGFVVPKSQPAAAVVGLVEVAELAAPIEDFVGSTAEVDGPVVAPVERSDWHSGPTAESAARPVAEADCQTDCIVHRDCIGQRECHTTSEEQFEE